MVPLTAESLLRIWEWGQDRHVVDVAVQLLALVTPEKPAEEIALLPIGQRDALLLSLRERTFGETLPVFAECPGCRESLEFTLKVADIRVSGAADTENHPMELVAKGYRLQFRLPHSEDLSAISKCDSVESARRLLLQRCVQVVHRRDKLVALDKVPDEVVARLNKRVAELDPQAEVSMKLLCPACGHQSLADFDIAAFIWGEISILARRLLQEVHLLARAYHWRESDILAMSAWRRHQYLARVAG